MVDHNVVKILIVAVLTLGFLVAEIAVAILTNSLALLSDAFHMISDFISLIIGLAALVLAKKSGTINAMSFGWGRAEILGGLMNGIFLLSISFYIGLAAIERFITKPEIKNPLLVIIIGASGLAVNIIGLIIFSGDSSVGHGHSHGNSHSHTHGNTKNKDHDKEDIANKRKTIEIEPIGKTEPIEINAISSNKSIESLHADDDDDSHKHLTKKATNYNIRALFLHLLGDALGSIAAIIVGVCIQFMPKSWGWKYYLDPALSIIVACIILVSGIPLTIATARILLQSVPKGLDVDNIREQLLKLSGVSSIHEFHVWQLNNDKIIATLHVSCPKDVDFMTIAATIKHLLHSYNIHSATIQPEFIADATESCILSCETKCEVNMCCKPRKRTARVIDTIDEEIK